MRTRAAALLLPLALPVALAMPAAQARTADGAEIAAMSAMAAMDEMDAMDDSAGAGVHDEPQAAPASATSVKAGFLYKFLGYVDFPAGPLDPGAPYVVGVVGAEDIAAELTRQSAGRMVNNHAVVVRNLDGVDRPGGLHLLFIGAADSADEAALVKAAQPAGVLTVTESATGIEAGSVINFRVVDERVRFDVSLEAAEKNSVKLSSRLLSVANHVQKGSP